MILNGRYASVWKHMRLSEPTTKIWMKIDPYCQQRRYSPMNLDSGNIKFMRIFAGVPWRWGIKQQWGNRKRGFLGFRTLRLRHFRKWRQHYYTLSLSPLSPFHWPKNTWPWMAILRSIFNFHYITNRVSAIRLHIYRRAYLSNIFVVWCHCNGQVGMWRPILRTSK